MLSLIVILIFVLIIASTWWFGFWSNLITLVNLILSGLIASSFYQDLSVLLEAKQPTYRMLMDFISIWLVFAGAFFVLRGLTDVLSKIRLKFDPITEIVGRSVLSIWIACVFVSFMLFSFHLAPLPPSYFSTPEQKMMGVGPDRMWAAFIQSRSRGALAASKDSERFGKYTLPTHPDDKELNARVFDPFSKFAQDNLARRTALSEQTGLRSAK